MCGVAAGGRDEREMLWQRKEGSKVAGGRQRVSVHGLRSQGCRHA